MNEDQNIEDLENISELGIKLINSSRKNNSDFNERDSDENQHFFHGFAWYATYIKAIENTSLWIKNLKNKNQLTEYELKIAKVGIGEFCLQIIHGIPMNQSETIRPHEIKIDTKLLEKFKKASENIINSSSSQAKQNLSRIICDNYSNGISPNLGFMKLMNKLKINFLGLLMKKLSQILINGI